MGPDPIASLGAMFSITGAGAAKCPAGAEMARPKLVVPFGTRPFSSPQPASPAEQGTQAIQLLKHGRTGEGANTEERIP